MAMSGDQALIPYCPDSIDQYHRRLKSVNRGAARTMLVSGQPSVIELTGQIKWFDVAKGYGFIIPENGLADILLHITCLHRDGYRVALEGARVVVAVVQSERGLQAVRILSMDTSTAKHAAEDAAGSHSCCRQSNGTVRARTSEMVQSRARLRILHSRRRNAGYFCTHGNPSPIWPHRLASGAMGVGAVRTRPKGINGGGSTSRECTARPRVPLGPGRVSPLLRTPHQYQMLA